MKKIIMLLFSTAMLTAAFAQSNDHGGYNRQGRYNREYDNNTVYQNKSYRIAQRNLQIQRVSAQYDYRIEQVSRDWSLNRREKKHIIKNLQVQKSREINRIYAGYNNSNVYNDAPYRNH